jgi:FkbM family methyltransferase
LILNTRRLFCRLLQTLKIETVCDVGSMDGSDALLFRRRLPAARIIALEPNPRNFALMEANEELRRKSIRILPFAASDRESKAPFFVVNTECADGSERARRGMSSLHRRSDEPQLGEVVEVRTARLDELLSSESLDNSAIAFWVDTEGMAFEVVSGAAAVLPSTYMLHIEVETEPIIGSEQKLFVQVEKALVEAGFVLLATDQPRYHLQFNALFVRADLPRTKAIQVCFWVKSLRLRRVMANNILRFAPHRLRRILANFSH